MTERTVSPAAVSPSAISPTIRRLSWKASERSDPAPLVNREWLVTNGLGGYASGTLAGLITRGFHGYLVAALPTPLGRVMMLNDLVETVLTPDGSAVQLGGEERVDAPLRAHGLDFLEEFRLESGIPVWSYRVGEVQIEKKIWMVHRQNTVYIKYSVIDGEPVRLRLRPSLNFRPHDAPVSVPLEGNYAFTVVEDTFEISSQDERLPVLRLMLHGRDTSLTMDRAHFREVVYRIEESRGYAARGDLWSPGYFAALVSPGHPVTLVASVESWETIRSMSPEYAEAAEFNRRKRLLSRAEPQARSGVAAELVLAADQFIVVPEGRAEDLRRAHAAGDEVRTVIAGYPWFTDWGRDTMISLEGLTLATGRHAEAGYILRTFAHYVRKGLIPNMFPEGRNSGLFHTADATLWFFHAIDRYLTIAQDDRLLAEIFPQLEQIISLHLRGTDFGIGVDPADGLLQQGAPGYQLTWMDAKVDDWVVTPRRGKAVEINALWYNALCLMEKWLRGIDRGEEAALLAEHARRARESFQKRFWYEKGRYLYDVVDGEGGDDPSLRPNQVLAISLEFPILAREKWEPVLQVVESRLLTPAGLRSLAPGEKDYKAKYYGDLRARDAAYHQGTVWPWLIGAFIDACAKVYPDRLEHLAGMLNAFDSHLSEGAVGSISEIFDAEPPYMHRGCVAQAWSVAEVLRCMLKLRKMALEQ